MNPVQRISRYGQSIWLDYIRRRMLTNGELEGMIEHDGLRGMTSNPKIFENAIAGSHDYDEDIRAMALEGRSADAAYEWLSVRDVRMAADLFRPVFDHSGHEHGFVSLEVDPHLAHDTEGTIREARRLWSELGRPNVLIKVPATTEGLPAIRRLIADGINVNVTLLFGLPRYREVADAYIAGLEERAGRREPLEDVRSVASFFLSRIDVKVDPMLERLAAEPGERGRRAAHIHGGVAIASAKLAYQIYREVFESSRFAALAERGARRQRLLWASTSTKNPAYSDVKYVEALIGPETVNTVPLETLNAYRDHGRPHSSIEEDVDAARHTMETLAGLGIDIDEVTAALEREGITKFTRPFDTLKATIRREAETADEEPSDGIQFDLGDDQSEVDLRIAEFGADDFVRRLWRRDPTLWIRAGRGKKQVRESLGWLTAPEAMESNVEILKEFVAEIRDAAFQHVVHLGMGGSSLTPLMLTRTFPTGSAGIPVTVLDTSDPSTIAAITRNVPLEHTLFIVATKSGSTAETLAFARYFYARVREKKGDRAGENFVAVTDPASPLVTLAQEQRYRRTFPNFPDVGGRYSALTWFGLLPAALMGLDVEEMLLRALRMRHACASHVPAAENPGVRLGAVIGELARHRRDKLTVLTSKPLAMFGVWLEQLLAESTGKDGRGILPVVGEPVAEPSRYGDDRLFVCLRTKTHLDAELDRTVAAIRESGQPMVTIRLDDTLDIAQEIVRWEVATATAGAILRVNPFDQPNVQESKTNTNRVLGRARDDGTLPAQKPALEEGPLSIFAERDVVRNTAAETLSAFLDGVHPRDYLAILAYLPETLETDSRLEKIRGALRDRLRVATTTGYGPRYLHSTGQLHKGGPNIGLFIQLSADDATDLKIPGKPYTFGTLHEAQARGDLQSLRAHQRRVIRIHLGADVDAGLNALKRALAPALSESRS